MSMGQRNMGKVISEDGNGRRVELMGVEKG